MRTLFLSHSSKDKGTVKAIADNVGKDLCWLDEWKIDPGDDLLERIDAALASSETRVFVLFWSEHARHSRWVEEEAAQARTRKLLRGDIRIICIVLDNATRPLWMEHLLWVPYRNDPKAVAAELVRLGEIPPELSTRREQPAPSFQNRARESDFLEEAYYAADKSAAIISGPPGIGKRSLCRFLFQHRLPHLRPLWVNLEAANTPALFYSLVATRLGLRIPESILKSGDWRTYWLEWVCPLLDNSHDVLVLENMHEIVVRNGALPDWIAPVISTWTEEPAPDRLPFVATTSRAVLLPRRTEEHAALLFLGRLSDLDTLRALRVMLSRGYPKQEASEGQLQEAAALLHGYPLAAQFWAAHATRAGVDLALLDPSPVRKRVTEFVADVISKCSLTADEQKALLLLSLLRFPLDPKSLVADLGVPSPVLLRLQQTMLLSPDSQGLSVHALLARYIVENMTSHIEVRLAHEQLGTYFKRRWQAIPEGVVDAPSVALGSQAYFHLMAAGKPDDAGIIRWCLMDECRNAVRGLYRMGRYDEVTAIAAPLLSAVGSQVHAQVRFYYALSLGHGESASDQQKAEALMQELLGATPNDRFYTCAYGDLLARWGRREEAKDQYRTARSLAADSDPVPSARLGELLLYEGNVQEAERFITEAYDRAPHDLRVIASLALLWERKGALDKALEIVKHGLDRRKNDIILNHRAGQILRQIGRREEALACLRIAAQGATSPASYTSLADLYLEMGMVGEASTLMARYRGPRDASYHNVLGHIALREGDFAAAEAEFGKCKKIGGLDLVLCGSMATLKVAEAEKAIEMLAYESAKADLVDAESMVDQGLAMDAKNQVLLRLQQKVAELKKLVLGKSQT